MTDDELKEIFASAPVAKDTFEVIAISAPWFSKPITYKTHLQKQCMYFWKMVPKCWLSTHL